MKEPALTLHRRGFYSEAVELLPQPDFTLTR